MNRSLTTGFAAMIALAVASAPAHAAPDGLSDLVTLRDTSWLTATTSVTPKPPWSRFALRTQGRLSAHLGLAMVYAGTSRTGGLVGGREYDVRESRWLDGGTGPKAEVLVSRVSASARRYIRSGLRDSAADARWRKTSVLVTQDGTTTLITFPKRRVASAVTVTGTDLDASQRARKASRYAARVSPEVVKRNRKYFRKVGTESFAWYMAIAFNGLPVVTGQPPYFLTEQELANTFNSGIAADRDYDEVGRFIATRYAGNGCVQIDADGGSMAPSVRITFAFDQSAGFPITDMSYGACETFGE